MSLLKGGALSLAPALLFATAALAQPAGSDLNRATVEEVVVTAQRMEQSLQDVPLSVTAITSATLERAGITDTMQLEQLAPALTLTMNAYNVQPYLRGIGTQQSPVGVENAVAVYIDGVYMPNSQSTFFSFGNIERVEVLRGPQGTLFGRNATGGLLQVITKTPDPDGAAEFSASYDNYETSILSAYLTGGLGANVSGSLAVFNRDQGKGWGRNIFLNTDVQLRDEFGVRGKLEARLGDRLTATLSADYVKAESDLGLSRNIYPGSLYIDGTPAIGFYDTKENAPSGGRASQAGASLKLVYDLTDEISLQSITAARYVWQRNIWEQDGTPRPVIDIAISQDQHTYQQEFLLQRNGERFDWTVGLFYFDDLGKYKDQRTNTPTVSASNFVRVGHVSTRSYAAFAQGTYALAPSTDATVGVRYTFDRKVLDGVQIALPLHTRPAGTILNLVTDRAVEARKLTWRLALDHRFDEKLMVYGSYNRGFKSGGFNAGNITQPILLPETLDAFEAGVKADLFERRLRLNLGAYHYAYKNIQLTRVVVGGTQTFNAARAESYGAELEVQYLPPVSVGRLQLTGSLVLAHGEYTSFPNGPIQAPNPAVCDPVPRQTGPATGGNRQCSGDLKGNAMIRLPDWTATAGFNYLVPAFGGEFGISANYYYNDGFFWEPDNRTRQKGYDVINAEVSWSTADGRFRVRGFGKNLGDTKYHTVVQEGTTGDLAAPAAPLTYGVGFDVKF